VTTRRDVLQATPGALASLLFVGCNLVSASRARAQVRRREVVVNGKRARTIDVHAHCAVPEALALMNLKLGGPQLRPDLDIKAELSTRLTAMDEQGIDIEALSINPTGTSSQTATSPNRSLSSRTRNSPRHVQPTRTGS